MTKYFLCFLLSLNVFAVQIHDQFENSFAALTSNYNPEVTSRVTGYSHKKRCMRDYVTVTGEDPLRLDGQTRDIKVKVYTNRRWKPRDKSGKSKTFIMMAPMGGVTLVDNFYANYWCVRYPFKILMIDKWPGYLDMDFDAYKHDLQFVSAVAAIRHVLEYSGESKVGIIGNSLGAIHSALAMGVDDRIKSGVLIVGGADIPAMMGKSQVKRIVYLRNKRKRAFGFRTNEEYIEYLRAHIKIDPIHFAHILDEKEIFFISDISDKDVPSKNQMLLKNAINPENYSQLSLGHVGAVIWTSIWFKKTFAGYFLKTL